MFTKSSCLEGLVPSAAVFRHTLSVERKGVWGTSPQPLPCFNSPFSGSGCTRPGPQLLSKPHSVLLVLLSPPYCVTLPPWCMDCLPLLLVSESLSSLICSQKPSNTLKITHHYSLFTGSSGENSSPTRTPADGVNDKRSYQKRKERPC
jgi:hypothetical protein